MSGTPRVEIARMIAQAELAGCGHLAGILLPTMRGELNTVAPMRGTVMPPLYRLEKQGRPIIAILGDDDYQPAGPSTWACAAKLRCWAAFAIVHGAGAERAHYDMAADLAKSARRLLLIETTSAAAQLWAAFLSERTPALPFMGILPRDGAHPVRPTRGGLH